MKYIIAIVVIIISTFLFKKAAGTLKINLINISSFTFYSLLIFEFIGITLAFLGYSDHYLLRKVRNADSVNKAYWIVSYTMIALPLTIFLCNRYIYKIKSIKEKYISNINQKVIIEEESYRNIIFIVTIIISVICLLSIIYVFCWIGYVPLFKYLDKNFNFATERIKSGRNFAGNQYIKNIIMITITPILSRIAYIYMRISKEKKWAILFIILFILNIFVKTYDFSKAPLIYYILYFLIIEILLGKTKQIKKLLPYGLCALFLIVCAYNITANYKGSYFSLSEGPLARIIMAQAGTLCLHVDAFPQQRPYLKGHSFPPITKFLFGEGKYDIRSGRSVMEIYNKKAIDNGTAGVMSTMFQGEAYANFGIFGVAISPIAVGLIISSVLCMYLKSEKTPLNIILYCECFIIFTTTLQGGIVDFFYNIQLYITLLTIFVIKTIAKNVRIEDNRLILKKINNEEK